MTKKELAPTHIPISELEKLYQDIIIKYDLSNATCLTRKQLKQKLRDNVENITNPICTAMSCGSGTVAIHFAASSQRNMQETLKILFRSGKIITDAIKRQQPWTFSGSLRVRVSLSAGNPEELLSFIGWIIQGI